MPRRFKSEDVGFTSMLAAARKRFEHVLPREYVSGEQVIYLGRRYSLKVKSVPRGQRAVKLKGALLEVSLEVATRDAVRARVRAWFRVKARDYFRDRDRCRGGPTPMAATRARLPYEGDEHPLGKLRGRRHHYFEPIPRARSA